MPSTGALDERDAAAAEPLPHVRPPRHRRERLSRTSLAWWAGVLALAVGALTRLEPLSATGLGADVGIQFYLAAETARGAVPVLDFEHGWNILGWYYLGLFYVLAGGQATLWSFLWGTVAGRLLAGVVLLTLARRHGLPARWILGLTAGLLLVSDVPNGKYALPALWLLLLRPGGRLDQPRASVIARLLLAAVLLLSHIELAVMLCLGTALYDLFGARGLSLHLRFTRVAALAVGGLLAFAGELAVYASLGVAPGELIRFLIIDRAGVSSAATAYDASLLRPTNLLGAAYPATLVVAFVPAVWRRLSDTTRLTAGLHLALGIIAIRKPDEGHLGAATVLLVVLVVLGAWDLLQTRDVLERPRVTPGRLLLAVGGGLWLLGAILAGFTAGSLLALPLLVGLTALGAVVGRTRDLPWASAGALVAAVGLTLVSTASLSLAEVRGPRDELQERVMATALEPEVARCLGPGPRQAWVVPEPLGLYTFLDLDNPTPYYLFWAGFVDESDRVLERMAAGEIPAVLQVNGWVASMSEVAPVIEQTYELCAEVATPAVPEEGIPAQTVRIWVDR
jgi:hypothetical protein